MSSRSIAGLAAVIVLTSMARVPGAVAERRVEQNVVYGMFSGLALLMDVHYPGTPNGYGIIFIPGSGWGAPPGLDATPLKENSERHVYAGPLVAAGYTVFAVNHRAAPRFPYPAAVEDVQRAVRFVRYHATRYGVSPDRIGAMGGSSGGHLASLLGVLDGGGQAGDRSPINRLSAKVQTVVARGAGMDFRACCGDDFPERYVAAVSGFMGYRLSQPADPSSGDYGRYAEASPITHVSPDDPPLLMLHGELDEIVPLAQAERMEEVFRKVGVAVSLLSIPGGGHDDTFGGVPDPPDYVGAMVEWFDQYLPSRP